jgi:adenylate cyclase
VTPFRSGGDPELHYLAEGLADDLIAGLCRFSSLAVLSRSSTFAYARAGSDPRQVAQDLGVNYVVQGSLARRGGSTRMTVELVDGRSGLSLWGDRYESDDLLNIQDEVVERLVATLVGRIEDAATDVVRRKRPDSLAAFDHLLQGQFYANRTDVDSNQQALDHLERAVTLEPDYALAWAWLGLMRLRHSALHPDELGNLAPAAEAADRALALDPADSWCHLVAGQIAMYRGDLVRAEVHHKKATALNPHDAHVMALRSPLATYLGKPEEGAGWIARAMQLNPNFPDWYVTNQGLAAYCARRYADAAAAYAGIASPQTGALAGLAASLARLGDSEGAARTAAQLLAREPGFSAALLVATRPFRDAGDREHLHQGLVLAGLPG